MTSDADQNDAVERKKKQEEYRRILDQQLAEHKQRKQEELQRQKLLEADDFEMTSNLNTGINYISFFFFTLKSFACHYKFFLSSR